ncbi:peroxide stress protein YaaA [Alpinimonas psychrophila]|uniref:Peroxide stress protein YaaA n=1 Tax=Alpinimonas psychrophila TaxID=748908 RepID=A0A7W3JUA9_9MICO|nr:peroxide stress protein YaaA [Alpinimonas psychrophila]MBA8829302.1 hypothetical protein [Alpinimonas psychrophila]
MLILLPPSETKRDGGEGAPLDLATLSFSSALTGTRKRILSATVALAKHPTESAKVLKLSAKQMFEVERNRTLMTSPTMPAIDRYTGVLFEALGAGTLPHASRAFLGSHTFIQSALLGPIGGLDMIPAYRLSFDSRLPKLEGSPLKKVWAVPAGKALSEAIGVRSGRHLVLDLRSEGYADLAPLPAVGNVFYVRVVTRGADGAVRALNHFNKKGKGEFLRTLAIDAAVTAGISSLEELFVWAATAGVILELGLPGVPAAGKSPAKPGELNLVVSGLL